jgi:hypothetical protein
MTLTLIDLIKERTRQGITGDSDYYKDMPYAFKIVTERGGKGVTGLNGEALFPLPLNPQVLEYELPFAAEVVPLQEGGVVADEGGIVIGKLRIEGTTGQKLRKNKDTSTGGVNGEFTGLLPEESSATQELSGHMALWRFLGRCFEGYSALKKDPKTSAATRMEFYGIKDRLYIEIVPRVVRIPRNTSDAKVIYKYSIEADVVGAAKKPSFLDMVVLSDDKSTLDEIKDTIHTARTAVQTLKATIDEFTACIDGMKRFVSNIVDIVDDIKSVVKATEDFITGASEFVKIPEEFMGQVLGVIDAALELEETATERIPRAARRSLQNATDAIEAIKVATRGNFKDDWDSRAKRHGQKVQRNANLTSEQKSSMSDLTDEADGANGQMSVEGAFGGNYTVGDLKRSAMADPVPSISENQYGGYEEQEIARGDSIQSLATKYMGDPKYWRDIAIANRLRQPYISEGARIPNTLVPGDSVLIPISRGTTPVQVLSTGDATPGSSQIDALMGTDFRARKLTNGKWDWWIDTAHGSVDLQKVSGIANLKQGLVTRIRTERMTNLNFPGVGLPNLVGTKAWADVWQEARFHLHQEVLSDPRIDKISGMTFEADNQRVSIELDAVPVGFDTSRTMPLTLT